MAIQNPMSVQSDENPAEALARLWEEGTPPNLADFLSRQGELGPEQLAEVLRVDQRLRWQRGKPLSAESYLAQFQSVRANPELVVDLIYHEFLLREQSGERPEPAEFEQRFPEHATTLRQQIALHGALGREEARKTQLQNANTLSAPTNHPEAPGLPPVFGRYRIERLLGRGGMGTVYLAYDTQLERTVALKVPQFDPDSRSRSIERFYREARMAATFHHANLCPVFDVGQIDGIHYLTMPYLQGEPLSAWLQRHGRLPPVSAARLTLRIAQALEVAHQAAVLHRDLKPANIMLRPDLEPVVMDFGLARRQGTADARLSSAGMILGTAAYMAPEQIGGNPDTLSPACDIYSLGAILYELLTGRTPFVGSVQEILQQTLATPPTPPGTRVPGIDPQLDAVCLRALAKDPSQRFASAAAFATALDEWLRQAESPAPLHGRRSLPWLTGPAHWSRRRWLGVVTPGAVLLAVMVGVLLPRHSEKNAVDLLPVNSRWEGRFRFRPPLAGYTGDATLEITSRAADTFIGTYATEAGQWQWEVQGSFRNPEIGWEFTRVLREPEPRNLVGRARITGELQGTQMTLLFKDSDSAADMTLTQVK